MSDLKEKAKKYWPWLVGGGIGIFLLVRMNSGSSGGGSDYASVMAAQAQASAQNAAAGLAQQNADRQYGLAVKTLDNQQTLGMATLAAQVEGVRGQLAAQMAGVEAGKLVSLTEIARAAQADKLTFEMGLTNIAAQREVSLFNSAVQGQVAYTTAQGAAGKEIALGTAAMIAQLQAPTVQAIQWEAQKDIAAFQSAASVAAAGYGAQAAEATAMGTATTAVLASLAAQANAQSNAVSTMFAGIAAQEANNVPSGLAQAVASKNNTWGQVASVAGTVIGGIAGI